MSDDLLERARFVVRLFQECDAIQLPHRPTEEVLTGMIDRIEELEAENNLLKTSGIIEVAVRNPSVMEYMQHWEGRAEAAEAKLAKAMEVLSAIDQYGSDTLSGRADGPDDRAWQREGVLEMTRRARTTLAELKGQGDE